MSPTREQIARWMTPDPTDAAYVRLPASAVEGVLYVLDLAEKAEGVVAAARRVVESMKDNVGLITTARGSSADGLVYAVTEFDREVSGAPAHE